MPTETAAALPADYTALLHLLADIRAAIGDPQGKLMQADLLARIRLLADPFPMSAVHYLARGNCRCQISADRIMRNQHVTGCMVGKAQAFLGTPVTWETCL